MQDGWTKHLWSSICVLLIRYIANYTYCGSRLSMPHSLLLQSDSLSAPINCVSLPPLPCDRLTFPTTKQSIWIVVHITNSSSDFCLVWGTKKGRVWPHRVTQYSAIHNTTSEVLIWWEILGWCWWQRLLLAYNRLRRKHLFCFVYRLYKLVQLKLI